MSANLSHPDAALAQQLEIATDRQRDVTFEKEAADARAETLQAQVGHMQETIKELQNLVDIIPNLQESLVLARRVQALPTPSEELANNCTKSG